MPPDELSPSAAARRIGATTRSVQRWIALGRLPARRVGGRWRVASDALDAFGPTGPNAPRAPAAPGPDRRADDDARAIRRVFIANRGEIARRIRRTTDRLGIAAVEPATDGPGAIELLDIAAVVAAAVGSEADAVHPGFGFLAESADFAAAVEAAGLTWIGPPPGAIRTMGDKAAARRLASKLGVPTVPGHDGVARAAASVARAAERIGYPLLVKPAAGGGGKGMRVVREPGALADAVASARREAAAAFGDDRVILERLVEGARHVEIQVLFDASGHGVHLGERDCSAQRRHQKVLEETPSPGVTPELRAELTGDALRLAAAVGYRGAGTCEFLVTDRGERYFLEMNTRLQVEHPVTELVLGVDLVEQQLRVAEGRSLGLEQAAIDDALARGGHAVEVRLYAEDAEDGFLPATGRVERLRWPAGAGIRVDAGVDEGSDVTARFDPMLAKIVAHAASRAEALDRLTAALDGTLVLGLTTNLRFLRWLVREPAVRQGELRVETLARLWPPDDWRARSAPPDATWRSAATALAGPGWGDGWRLNAPPRLRLVADAGGDPIERIVEGVGAGGDAGVSDPAASQQDAVTVGDVVYVDVGGRSVAFRLARAPDVDRAARAAGAHRGGGTVEIVAPMPGSIVAMHTTAGATVEPGDVVVTLEAMKMEHAVPTPAAGRVGELHVRAGDQVARGDLLATIEP